MLNAPDGFRFNYEENRFILLLLIGSVGLLIFSGWYWWNKVYESPTNVFWGMISNSLDTTSLYKSFSISSQGATLDESVQLQLGVRNVAYSLVSYTQSAGVVKVAELNTPTDDYLHYIEIKTNQKSSNGQNRNFQPLLGYWGRETFDQKGTSNFKLYYKTLTGFIAFGDLNPDQRTKLLKFVKDNKVYQFKSSDVQKTNLNGRAVYNYKIQLSQVAYLSYIKEFSKIMGLPALDSINPSDYQNSPAVTFKIAVDASSHELSQFVSPDGSNTENYSGFNIVQPNIPSSPKTTIPLTELEKLRTTIASD
jgi:hypothetical protein